jgi:Putative prokaryotic signal transducing protein
MAESQKSKAEEQPCPDPNEKLVKVFESEEETEALMVKGLLESASIESDLAPLSLTQYAFPNVGGTIILVREEDAERARRLIAESRQTQPDAGEEAEEDSIEEPPATV